MSCNKTMRNNNHTSRALLTMASFLLLGRVLSAQSEASNPPLKFGGFDNTGEVTAGYRFTDVRGYRPQYDAMFGLRSGFRVEDMRLSGQTGVNNGSFADRYSFTASGIGGDPYSTTQFRISKSNLYDFNVTWRQSYYYWNQNDNVALPITSIATTLSTGLTNNHDRATVRKMGSANLTLHATRNLQFTFEIGHGSNDGAAFTTRSLDFFNAPAYWASFARANPYYLSAPLQDSSERVAGGLDYTLHGWSFHYKVGYQTYNENTALNGVVPDQVSINPVALSLTEPLASLSWSQSRKLTAPDSEFSFNGNLTSRLQWRGSYVYYRYHGPATMDQSENGIAPGSTGVLTPYAISESGRATVSEPSHVVTQGITYALFKWWDIDVDYRYSQYNSEANSNLQSLFNATTLSMGTDNSEWNNSLHELRLGLAFRPTKDLLIRPGIRLLDSDVEALSNGVVDLARTQRTKTAQPEADFSYTPLKTLSIRGDIHHANSDAAYTAITPDSHTSGRLSVRYQPLAQLSIEDSMKIGDSRLLESNFKSSVRSNSTNIFFAWNNWMSLFGGFTYDSFFASGDIVYARGPAPLNTQLQNQEINRIWQAGFEVKPTAHSGIRMSGNYDRTTGVGQIVGEPPAYGPMTWPMVSGSAFYDFRRVGKISVDLQRTYYDEELVPANNFSANLLTIRWTRSF